MRDLHGAATQAVEDHTNYWRHLSTGAHSMTMVNFLRSYRGVGSDIDHMSLKSRTEVSMFFSERERRAWGNGPTVLIDPETHYLVTEMMESMPPAPLTREVLPSPAGVLMLPDRGTLLRYLNVEDQAVLDQSPGHENVFDVRALAWAVHEDVYGNTNLPPDAPPVGGVDVIVYLDPDNCLDSMRALGEITGDETEFHAAVRRAKFLVGDFVPWSFGTEWRPSDDYLDRENLPAIDADGVGLTDPHVGLLRRYLLALWEFMGSELVVTDPLKTPRHTNRRVLASGRMAEIPEDGTVRVAHLRRAKFVGDRPDDDTDAEDRDAPLWSHRWYVRPHWRRLANGRVIPVRGYVKGPEDRPLVLKDDVLAVDR